MKYGFIYETTNLITGMKYIGQHKRVSESDDVDYLGSGVYLRRALEKYGEENFNRVILCECDSDEELNMKEEYYLKIVDAANNPLYYNITNSGYKGGLKGYHHTEEIKKVMSEKSKNYWDNCNREKRSREYSGIHNPFYGKKHSEETIETIREHMPDFSGENNPFYGHVHTEETKKRISESREKYKGENHPWYGREHKESTKKAISEYNKGKIYVNNGEIMKFVKSTEELEYYLSIGWSRGRLKGCTKKKG